MSKNDGGPAFPQSAMETTGFEDSDGSPGMSLRDWFAGHVDEAWDIWLHLYAGEPMPNEDELIRQVVSIRGKLADAMLAEREEKP